MSTPRPRYAAEASLRGTTLTLYHATNMKAYSSIRSSKRMISGTYGAFGCGMYFARTPDDARRKSRHGSEAVFAANVTLNNPVRLYDKWEWLTPAILRSMGFDSVITDRFNGTEFVVFSSDNVQPLV
jgi:hypothetical protein